MLGVLLAKDLRRARRNPIPFLIHIAVPVLITALIGMTFGGGGGSGGGSLGRIHVGIVDEDDSTLSRFLRNAVGQGDGAKYLQPEFLTREQALLQISENRLSAVLILPKNFASEYLGGTGVVTIELIKNPAQSFYPAIIEELASTLVTGMNVLGRNFRPELASGRELLERRGSPPWDEWAELVRRMGSRAEAARELLFPPRIAYSKGAQAARDEPKGPVGWNIFGYLLPGLAAMFLLFIADNAIRDLYREERFRTFERMRTVQTGVFVFVASKGLYAFVILMISSLILFGGGSLIFRIRWQQPFALTILCAAYALFAAGFMAWIAALAGSEKRADTFNTIAGMALGLAGGSMFPREQLPALFRDHVTPLMPTHWFAAAARGLEGGPNAPSWLATAAGLALLGGVLISGAAWLFERRMLSGTKT